MKRSLPNSVTGIGDYPFVDCTSLMAIAVDANNPVYSSLDGVLFNHNRTNGPIIPVVTTVIVPCSEADFQIPSKPETNEDKQFNNVIF